MNAWHEPVTSWRRWLVAADCSPRTIRLRTHQIRALGDWAAPRGPWSLRTADLVRWLGAADWATETRRSHRSAAVSFYRWGVVDGRLEVSPAATLPPVRAAHHLPRPTPEAVLAEAVREAAPRVRLMLLLGARLGLRRGEIAVIHRSDVVRSLGGWTLRVHGKGRKDRLVPLPEDLDEILRGASGWLFPGQIGGHLSADTVGTYMSRAMPQGWTAHTLRHRFATRVYAGTRDLLTLQALLGHAHVDTTRGYVELPDDAARAALAWAA